MDAVGEEDATDGFGEKLLAIFGFLSSDVVGAWGEGVQGDWWLIGFALPDAGDAQ